jgi:hypothetical protein
MRNYVLASDWWKAFDLAKFTKLMLILKETGINWCKKNGQRIVHGLES